MAARTLMIQGTASHVGKSVLVAALCRLFLRRGLRVAPFKAQNMSNNSFVTPDGREIGRAQAVQAAACRLAPRSDFNPVLIKPENDRRAQLVVNGKVAGSLVASDFGRIRREYFPTVQDCFARLREEFDLVILEGAGSPAEPNLREQDIVNMRMAREANAPVLLVGDIDRGGVFAALVGTLALLEPGERGHVKGCLINKFRGDPDVLAPGLRMLEDRTTLPCLGVLPLWDDLRVPQEDSLGWDRVAAVASRRADLLTIAVADVPAISNFTDFEALLQEPDVQIVRLWGETDQPLDALIFPGTKNTAQALHFIKTRGLDRLAKRMVREGGTVVGICGGYQILGTQIRDPHGIESPERELEGVGLLDVVTSFARKKVLIQVVGSHRESGCPIEGYQVHMGRTRLGNGVLPLLDVEKPDRSQQWAEGASAADGRVFGTYVHGLFDTPAFRRSFLNLLRARRGWDPLEIQAERSLDQTLDDWADFVAQHVDLSAIAAIIERGV
ncbi:MAG: cobyric acid synthase [Nitrospiraceae bacterium]|nr:MAG: cobyric acid synthase [Nitrospiraceae bacterium]